MKPIKLALILVVVAPLGLFLGGVVLAEVDKEKRPTPTTLEEAHIELERIFSKEELAKIDAMKSEREMGVYHFGLGTGLRNDWGLWHGGPLAKHMNKLGFIHPDDMSGVILATFWCKRHNKDFRLKERAAYYDSYWKAAADPPESARDPDDKSEINWTINISPDGTRWVHYGKSKNSGRWLVYEYDKGVYLPDDALMKLLADVERDRSQQMPK